MNKINYFDTAALLAAAAALFYRLRQYVNVALSGGNTPSAMYEL
jgi:6-phosphogluconolactonase/glucosamine-6-phosphate isomerase/deaminase